MNKEAAKILLNKGKPTKQGKCKQISKKLKQDSNKLKENPI